MLKIKNLKVNVAEKNILNGINLEIKKGEIFVVMGPNGSGKSSLSSVIMGNPKFQIKEGSIFYKNKNINKLSVSERACAGIFLAHQNPREIAGVALNSFLFEIHKNSSINQGKKPLNVFAFREVVNKYLGMLEINVNFLDRNLNVSMSGGEKKKLEILQMLILEPDFIILDEIDSGLDVDALKIIGNVVNNFLNKKRGLLIITHHSRILKYIKPNKIIFLEKGKITQMGGLELIDQLEKNGFKK